MSAQLIVLWASLPVGALGACAPLLRTALGPLLLRRAVRWTPPTPR